jgi:hypothetical protein
MSTPTKNLRGSICCHCDIGTLQENLRFFKKYFLKARFLIVFPAFKARLTAATHFAGFYFK